MVVPPAHAQIGESQASSLRAMIDEMIDEGEPGVAVGVVIDGDVAMTHYAGLANLDVPSDIGPKTRFNIASVAKQFTALMVLDLASSGQIDLSEDFRTYLPTALPEVEQRISVNQLLTHTSGIRDIYDLWAVTGVTWYERPFRNRDVMALLNRQTSLNFEPGTNYWYSNSNYVILAQMVARVTGERFDKYAAEFFSARNMPSTGVKNRYGDIVPSLARAYGNWSGWFENAAIANTHGDGFLFTTLPDQLRWETQVWGNDPTLSAEVIATSQKPIDGMFTQTYGYGLEMGSYKGLPTVYHVGSTGGYNAYTLRFPSKKMSIVVMGNTTQVGVVGLGNGIADELLESSFTVEATFPPRPEVVSELKSVDDYLGLYELDSGTFLRLVIRDGDLFREIEGRDPVRMVPDEGNLFDYETIPGLKLALMTDDEGERSIGLFSPDQAPQLGTPLTEAPSGDRYRKGLEGTYVNDETDTEIVLEHKEDDTFIMTKNGRARNATLVSEGYLIWNGYRIRVQRRGSRKPYGLIVDNGRARNIRFDRQRD
ncbi:MAG: serine hydrolase domain-containing protein [Pseudomonadota bacterium]